MKSYNVEGKEYHTLTEIAAAYGKSIQLLEFRMNSGMSLSEAATTPLKQRGGHNKKPVTINEKTYESYESACKEHNTNSSTARSREQRGFSESEAITSKPNSLKTKRSLDFRGTQYKSKKDCVEKNGLNYKNVLLYQQRHNISFSDAMEHYLKKQDNTNEK